ncbi:MAG: Rieske 2Fe-2S domain-containing protein [Snowella sp.]|nr:Rieske 2Fe-2S domain-containing protein [Snowella sp.]
MSSEFNFFQQWYPVSPIQDLKRDRPTPVTLLGQRLVIWQPRDSEQFSVLSDQCPHRLAPLSEGRVDEETGLLMCSYHGWQFDDQGVCTYIPQLDKEQLDKKVQEKYCVVSYPTREEQDLLWVWADPNSADLAATTPLPLSAQMDASKGFVWDSLVRDLAYDWQTLIENIADPSHVPFTHHGVQGDRKQGRPIPMEILESTMNLIEVKLDRSRRTTITFEPPCRLEYTIHLGDTDKQLGLVTYCIPTEPGKSRIVAHFARNFAQKVHTFTPRWWSHIKIRNPVLDGDMIVLQHQEAYLQQRQEPQAWKNAYLLPASSDRFVIEFRKWFDKYCQGQLPWSEVGITAPISQINEDRKALLDRYHQHTQHCASCREALTTIQNLQIGLLIFFILDLLTLAASSDAFRNHWGIPLAILALLSLGLYGGLKGWLEPQFYFVDYVHADKK